MPERGRRGRTAPPRVGAVMAASAAVALLVLVTPAAARGAGGGWSGEGSVPGRATTTAEAPVADAAMRRDSAKVRGLLREGADVNASQGDGMTALHWAASHGDAGVVRMLVAAGARVDVTTRNGKYTPLHLASRNGRAAAVRALLEAGSDPKAATSAGGTTALHLAASHGDTATISALVGAGVSADIRDAAHEQTPLMWAAAANRIAALRTLLAHRADVSLASGVVDVSAAEKAQRAAAQLRNRRVAALKAAEQPPRPAATVADASRDGANERGGGASTQRPAGGASAAAGNTPEGERAQGSDSTRNTEPTMRPLSYGDLVGKAGGLTALHFAVRQGNREAVEILLGAGADVNQVTGGDETSPLLMATINGHFDIARLLLERGADAKRASDAGTTPLYATLNVHWAPKSLYPQPTAQYQQQVTYLELMEALLKAGADPNARLTRHLWFMSYNFDLLGVNSEGATPFWRAAYGTDVPAMKLLLAHGADATIPTRKPAGRLRGDDAPAEGEGGSAGKDPSGLPPIPVGGPGVYPIHAASGVGYGEGYAANSHRHAPDAWIPAVKFLIEELGADVNARDHNGFTPLHHAAARGDNALIEYLLSKGADISAVSRRGQTVADMANGPVQRIPPFVETVALLEKLGSKNSNKCRSC